MNTPEELKYSEDHEWVRVDGNIATIGITDFAQDQLGDVVYVDVPDVGASSAAGDAISEVESTKSVSDIIAPVSGKVVEANAALDDDPTTINSDPYGAGWIYKVEMSNPGDLDSLLDAAGYSAFTAE